MPVHKIDISSLLEMAASVPVIDVRSPSEFAHAHFPGSHNIALFSDEERAQIGTLYKTKGRQPAVLLGLDFFGPRMKEIISKTSSILDSKRGSSERSLIVHCWRGGMRSSGVAWLLDLYGFDVYVLEGGYKSFRRWVIEQLDNPPDMKVLGGFTGSRKTDILCSMKSIDKAYVIDLEGLASHRGSAFGSYGMKEQPSQEMFENLLSFELDVLRRKAKKRIAANGSETMTVWIEDESQRIGRVNIPNRFWEKMRSKQVHFLDVPFDERLSNICSVYGSIDRDVLVGAITRIKKKLGGLETKTSIARLLENDVKGCFEILLRYYDRLYRKSLSNRPEGVGNVRFVTVSGLPPERVADQLLNDSN